MNTGLLLTPHLERDSRLPRRTGYSAPIFLLTYVQKIYDSPPLVDLACVYWTQHLYLTRCIYSTRHTETTYTGARF